MRYLGGDDKIQLAEDDKFLIVELAKCNLDLHPTKSNWI